MNKTPNLEGIQTRFFWALVTLGVLFLGSICLLIVRPSFCPESEEWAAQTYDYSYGSYDGTERRGYILAKKKITAEDEQGSAYKKIKQGALQILCADIKVTDVVVAFLTAFLGIFGWYQMHHTDQTTKRSERAYLIAGPLFGIPNHIRGDGITKKEELDPWMRRFRAKKSMFHGPWRMAILNFGQTAAFTTLVEWGLCPLTEFRTDVLVSHMLDRPEFARWRSKYLREPITIQDIFSPNPDEPLHYRHIEIQDEDRIKYIDWVFFGRIKYKDVFRDEHFSTFSYHLLADHADSIGKSLSDDHS